MAAETHADSDEIPDLIGVSRPRPTFVLTRALFLRLLGAIYLVAFLSLTGRSGSPP